MTQARKAAIDALWTPLTLRAFVLSADEILAARASSYGAEAGQGQRRRRQP
jgi:hypothetical protein